MWQINNDNNNNNNDDDDDDDNRRLVMPSQRMNCLAAVSRRLSAVT